MKITNSKSQENYRSKLQLGFLMLMLSFNTHAFFGQLYDYFLGSGTPEEETETSVRANRAGAYTVRPRARPELVMNLSNQSTFNQEIISCTRDSSLNILTPGISGVMSFMDDQFCDQSRLASISRAQGQINVENACAEVFELKRNNVCQFDEGVSPARLEEVMGEMRQNPEVRAEEVVQKAAIVKDDMEKIKHLSLLHMNFAANPILLNMIKNRINRAKSSDHGHYLSLLEKYNMSENDQVDISVIAEKAFQCSPEKIRGSNENGRYIPSEFDESPGCNSSEESDLFLEAKQKINESCIASGDLCPAGLDELIGNDPNRLYDSFAVTAIGGELNGEGPLGGLPLAGISDFGPSASFEENGVVVNALQILDSGRAPAFSTFLEEMNSPQMAGKTRVERIMAMRTRGARLTQERFTNAMLPAGVPQQDIKLAIMQRLTDRYLSDANEGRNNALHAGGQYFDLELAALEESGVTVEFTSDEINNFSTYFISLAAGSNYAEDTFNRLESLNKIQEVFDIDNTDNRPFTTMLERISQTQRSGSTATDELTSQVRDIIRSSPYLQTMMELNSDSGDDFLTGVKKLLFSLRSSEVGREGSGARSQSNFANAMTISEMDQANKAIDACNQRKSDRWKEDNFCSSFKSPNVAAAALKSLFEGPQGSNQDTLSKALIYCGPILQHKYIQDNIGESGQTISSQENSCFHISEVLYDIEAGQEDEFYQKMFGLSCKNKSYTPFGVADDGECHEGTAGYVLGGISVEDVEAASTCRSDDTEEIIAANPISVAAGVNEGGGSIAESAIMVGREDVSVKDLVVNLGNASSKSMERRGRNSGNSNTIGPNFYPKDEGNTGEASPVAVSSTRPNLSDKSESSRIYNDPIQENSSFQGINENDYRNQNTAIRAITDVPSTSSTGGSGGAATFSDELIGQEGMLGSESNELLARLRAKEEELDGKLRFYNDVLAAKETDASETVAERTLRVEKEKLENETRDLERRLREQTDATAALAAARENSPARRSMASVTSGLAGNVSGGGSSARAVNQGPISNDVAPTPSVASGIASAPSSGGNSRTIASVEREYEGSAEAGSFSTGASISLVESGGESHQLTNGEVVVYSSIDEAEGNIVDPNISPSIAALNANGVILIPTETEGLFTQYIPVMEDDAVKTLDGEVEFKSIVQVWISDVGGGPAPARAPIRLQEFDIIQDAINGEAP